MEKRRKEFILRAAISAHTRHDEAATESQIFDH